MSTKINSRSPFYFTATEPTTTETFTCTTANLQGFSVASNGNITEPTPQKGTIIARSHTSFSQLNVGDSNTPRTVTYTIKIPSTGFTNSGSTIDCQVSFTQLAPTTCDPSSNNNMLVFTGTIPDQTNVDSTGVTISLGSFFTLGSSGATFKRYEVVRVGNNAFNTSLSDTTRTATLTITSSQTCASATFFVRAFNNSDACFTDSLAFTVSTPCSAAFDCNTANLRNGILDPTGALVFPDRDAGDLHDVTIKSINGSTASPAGQSVLNRADQLTHLAYTTGADRTVILTFTFNVPLGYSNYSSPEPTQVDCDFEFTQRSSGTIALECEATNEGDPYLIFKNISVDSTGIPRYFSDSLQLGTYSTGFNSYNQQVIPIISVTSNVLDSTGTFYLPTLDVITQAQANISGTAVQVRVTFKVPSSPSFTNSGQTKTCIRTVRQDISGNPCGQSGFFDFQLSSEGFFDPLDFCDNQMLHMTLFPVRIQANGFNVTDITAGSVVCTREGTIQNSRKVNGTMSTGTALWWGVARGLTTFGDNGTEFFCIQISKDGTIQSDPVRVLC